MAELVLASIASYVASEMINKALSELFRKLEKQAAADKQLQRLEMLLVKIRSAVEVSEKHSIESASLLRWKERLMEAASHGHAVLDSFNQRAMNTQAAATDTDQQGSTSTTTPPPSPTAAASNTTSANDNDDAASRALSFTRAALSGMQHGMRNAANKMFSGDEDMQKLKNAVESLEELSSGIGEFTQLLQLEVSLPQEEEASGSRTRTRRREMTPGVAWIPLKRKNTCKAERQSGKRGLRWVFSSAEQGALDGIDAAIMSEFFSMALQRAWIVDTEEYQQFQIWKAPLQELRGALEKIRGAVAMAKAEAWEKKELRWFSQWAAVIKEAWERGCTVHGDILCYLSDIIFDDGGKSSAVKCDHGTEEVYSLVHILEIMAADMEHFSNLVRLCRALPRAAENHESFFRAPPSNNFVFDTDTIIDTGPFNLVYSDDYICSVSPFGSNL